MVDGKRSGVDGGGYDLLDRETGELGAEGVSEIGILAGDDDGARDIGGSLVGVERDGSPPLGDGGRRSGGGDGGQEIFDENLLGKSPFAVPNNVNVDGRGGENRPHVVPKIDQIGGAFEFLGGGKRRRWKFGVVDRG